ncbi:hypothetical protein B9J09_11705 [Xylella fastidiosa subsp. pauca]|nr:hypothetical protein B9J09_11705 [Xylella fastidiosa subsp. pauca]AVI21584.1 hypothetical protein BCV75_10945 [Xylella fastidiosa]AVI23620.1 hypothetical protein BC375_11010 [Xylella fastidiosa]KIA57431.1 hypothetical protein RA12_11000 [Xylella fastidiosa]KXB10606.1 hypothetical protein ADT32_07495 [Xylella fastidiosa]
MAPPPQHALLHPLLELAGAVAAALRRQHRDQQADHEQCGLQASGNALLNPLDHSAFQPSATLLPGAFIN